MALSELSERCYRTIGHYRSTIGVLSEFYRSSLSDYRTRAQAVTLACMACRASIEWPRATMVGRAWGESGSLEVVRLTPKPSRQAPQNSDMFGHTDGRSNAVRRRCHWSGTRHTDSTEGSRPQKSKIRRKTRRALLRRDPTVRAHAFDVPPRVQVGRTCSRPPQACGARPAWWDGRPGSAGCPGGRGLKAPATKHANSVMAC